MASKSLITSSSETSEDRLFSNSSFCVLLFVVQLAGEVFEQSGINESGFEIVSDDEHKTVTPIFLTKKQMKEMILDKSVRHLLF